MIRSLLAGIASAGLIAASAGAQQAYESHTPGYGWPAADAPGTTSTTVQTSTDPASGAMVEQRTVIRSGPIGEPEWVQRMVAADMARDDAFAKSSPVGTETKPPRRFESQDQPPAPPPGY